MRILLLLIVLGCGTLQFCNAGGEYFPYLYQRTVYTDNLMMPGAWWSNPAIIADIDAPYVHTANVLPLGDSLLISSFRFFLPVKNIMTIGASILGAGAYATGSSRSYSEGSGFSHQSSFAFSRPRFQLGAATRVPYFGKIGVLGTIGSDLRSTGSGTQGSASPGIGMGWMSPAVFNAVTVSASGMFIYHNLDVAFWEKNGKLGLLVSDVFDSLLSGSFEYTFTVNRGFGVFYPQDTPYDALKAMLSLRLFRNVAALAGYSTDIADKYGNGHCVHAGLELKKSNDTPMLGGYEIGFRFGQDWIIFHRIWVGLNFRTLARMQPRQ